MEIITNHKGGLKLIHEGYMYFLKWGFVRVGFCLSGVMSSGVLSVYHIYIYIYTYTHTHIHVLLLFKAFIITLTMDVH